MTAQEQKPTPPPEEKMMKQKTYTETANFGFVLMPSDSWRKKLLEIRRQGLAKSADLRNEGRAFCVEILGSREVPRKDVPLSAALLDLDWRLAAELEMVESARDLITNACALDYLDGALPTVLKAIIEGRGLYEHSIGEFFLLYGKFEQKHNTQGWSTKKKMEELVGGDNQYMKSYIYHGNTQIAPLPYVVRNILAHKGSNPNTLDQNGDDLRISVELLREWTATTAHIS